ncbi:MAG: DUF4091 domain-containing protein [Clostridia bacterium]|nr:DUF4091 domain-containing protein [Clostridia bacterium]
MSLRFVLTGSLEKVLPDREPAAWPYDRSVLPLGDRLGVQIAYWCDFELIHPQEARLFFEAEAPEGVHTQLYSVGLVPVRVACTPNHDDDYLTHSPAMLPDILWPYDEQNGVRRLGGQWRSIWVDLHAETAGEHTVELRCKNAQGECLWSQTLTLQVSAQPLPKQKLIHTEWFHADCLADYYGLEVFGEQHWQVIENFIACAAAHGVNMLLTPVVTPALDTAVGGERTTVQLCDIYEKNGGYTFDFAKLERWLGICQKYGIENIEICHLFTQWGARHAPKVMVHTGEGLIKRFGWETDALDPAYTAFLHQLIPALKDFLREKGVLQNSWFHISDEPHDGDEEDYRKAQASVLPLLQDVHLIDALSSFDMYQTGIVKKPVVSTNHVEPFLEAQVPGLWVYYCVSQGKLVSNRFMSMPSRRNRILGVQLYLYHIEGFLHWGYNFYNSQYSIRHLDPFAETDSGEAFPSGDPFLVYPGEDGKPISSLRLEVLYEALRDLRALQMLESLKGRAFVESLISRLAGQKITFSDYPRNDAFVYELRRCVNEELAQA